MSLVINSKPKKGIILITIIQCVYSKEHRGMGLFVTSLLIDFKGPRKDWEHISSVLFDLQTVGWMDGSFR